MQTRIVSALDRIRQAHPGGTVVCVSHADPIKAAAAHAMGTHIDLFQRIVISTCSITAIAYSVGGPVVLTVNSTGGPLSELRPS
jgi:broad specificity phosphatase PhoE